MILNGVRVVSGTTGTGTLSLGSAVNGFATIDEAGGVDGAEYSYAIEADFDGPVAQSREFGIGTWTSSVDTLTRTVLMSITSTTVGTSPLDLGGDAQVIVTPLAETFQASAKILVVDETTYDGLTPDPDTVYVVKADA